MSNFKKAWREADSKRKAIFVSSTLAEVLLGGAGIYYAVLFALSVKGDANWQYSTAALGCCLLMLPFATIGTKAKKTG